MSKNKLLILSIFFLIIFGISELLADKREYKLSNQLIINGDFEGGNVGFQTDYKFSPSNMRPEGTYCLSQNPKKQYSRFDSCSDKTNQSGFMLLVNGSDLPDMIVWKQTVRGLDLNSIYLFSFWSAPVYSLNPPFFEVFINGVLMQPSPIYLPPDVCKWTEIRYIWNSGNIDTAEIIIYNRNQRKSGNDFVIDDISFSIYCSLVTSAQKLLSTCKGGEVQLNVSVSGGEPPFKYEWFPKTGLDNPYSPNPNAKVDFSTTYIVKIVDSKFCEAYDTVNVNIYPLPQPTINSDKGLTLCPCDSVKLIGPPGMSQYFWSTGEQSPSIITKHSGAVSLKVIDKNGCSADTTVFIQKLDVSAKIQIGELEANIGDTITLPVLVKWSDTKVLCDFTISKLGIAYNKSILQPIGTYSNRSLEGDLEYVEIIGKNIEDLINNLKFKTVLGKVECSPIEITQLNYDCNEINVSTYNGRICLNNLCKEGGTRLVDTDKILFLSVLQNSQIQDEINIQFGVIESGPVSIQIYDYLGRKLITYDLNNLEAGTYDYTIDKKNLNSGLHFILLITQSNTLSKPIIITK
ncbi:MAG: T9SS type A sorting domain-containing protein [Candidatus Kapabacteria bacterium]|nr:T9SS type A sorting domain-containing protein [Candidatus Kapabacteria bacterium]